jgi:hypothetical protein
MFYAYEREVSVISHFLNRNAKYFLNILFESWFLNDLSLFHELVTHLLK